MTTPAAQGHRQVFTVAACYTGPLTANGGRVSIVTQDGRRTDHTFGTLASAFDVVPRLTFTDAQANVLTRSILDAMQTARSAFLTGNLRCGF